MSDVSPLLYYIPTDISQQKLFLSKYPEFDGRGTKIAVIDGAVDLSLDGLQKTSDGLPKIIDCFDFTGAGDVDISVVREMDAERCLTVLSGRKFKIPVKWKNLSNKWHLGLKSLYKPMTKLKLPEIDCIVWFNGKKWEACIETLKEDDLENAKVLANFRDEHEYGILLISELELCYCITINDEESLLQIFTPYCDHGSAVAQVAAANFSDKPEQNGLAPGAQVVSMNVIHPKEILSYSAVKKALLKCIEMKVGVINYSISGFGTEDFVENLINKIAKKTKIFIFKSAGNIGPFHFTVSPSHLQIEESIFIIGAVLTNDIKKRIYATDNNSSPPSLCSFSSRGPSYNGSRGLDFVAPGVGVLDLPRFIKSRKKEVIAGTSFSSPNAAGAVACLLSALKKHSIPFSPASIKFALSQTAILPKNGKKCEFGNGIIQIYAAFEYCKNDIFKDFKIIPRKKGAGGIIFIKDKCHTVNMKRTVNLQSYINTVIGKKVFKKWILKIPTEAQNIIAVTQIDKNGLFILNVDTSKMEIGDLEYVEIEVMDPCFDCIFYIPVTVILPLKGSLDPENYRNQKEITLNYENPCHIFVEPPLKCGKKYEIKITPLETEDVKTNLYIQYSYDKMNTINVGKDSDGIVKIFLKKVDYFLYGIQETFQAKHKNIHEICIYQQKYTSANQKFLLQFTFFEGKEIYN